MRSVKKKILLNLSRCIKFLVPSSLLFARQHVLLQRICLAELPNLMVEGGLRGFLGFRVEPSLRAFAVCPKGTDFRSLFSVILSDLDLTYYFCLTYYGAFSIFFLNS